jgi:CBS domain-containing protein
LVLIVRDVMTPQVVTIEPTQSVKNAARRMTMFGISSLLVLSKEGLKGIITEKDIISRVVCMGLVPAKVR